MRTVIIYILLLLGAIGAFLLINATGAKLHAPEAESIAPQQAPGHGGSHVLVHVLLTMAAVVALGWLLSKVMAYIGQPPVIGEVVAGIVLGPSLLGRISPDALEFLLPHTAAPFLSFIAQIGVILYMFLVGLELNPGRLKESTHATILISHSSMVLPFVFGAALALFLYPRLSSADVPFMTFALFLGVALSITAFPVLARILTDRGMHTTTLGATALACAAANDVTAWCLLALAVGIAQAKVVGALATIGLTVVYLLFMLFVVRPIAVWLIARSDPQRLTRGAVVLVFLALLLSVLATEWIGIHAIFGAFVLGAVIPHDSTLARTLTDKLEDLVTVLLLPAYFAFTGMRTEIGLVAGWEQWLMCGLIIVVATVGKFGGTVLSARTAGMPWRQSSALGILMNTRGLMELIVLNVGLELRIISPTLFAMMVLMALVTTMATTPILQWILGDRMGEPDAAPVSGD